MAYTPIARSSELALFKESAHIPNDELSPGEIEVLPQEFSYILRQEGSVLYVIYSQTFVGKNLKDLMNVLDPDMMAAPGIPRGQVVEKAFKQYALSEEKILEAIKNIAPEEVVVAGYSKGGVHALYAAYRLLIKTNVNVVCRAFAPFNGFSTLGADEVNEIFKKEASRLNLKIILNAGDPVPSYLPGFLGRENPGKAVTRGKNPLVFIPDFRQHAPSKFRKILSSTVL